MRNLSYTLLSACLLLVCSCQNYEDFRAIDGVEYEADFAVPLINTSLSIDEILENEEDLSFLNIEPDGSMSANYTEDEIKKEASELIETIEDFPIVLIDSSMSIPVQLFDNMTVTSLSLKSGSITFDVQSSHTEDIDLSIIFPDITKNGTPFQISTIINYNGQSPVLANIAPELMDGFDIILAGGNLDIRYEAYNMAGDRVLLDLITGEAQGWEFSHIEGIWDNETFTVDSDTFKIELFDSWVSGQINFEDPKLILDFSNSIGIPIQMKLQNLTAQTADGTIIPITSVFSDGFNLNYPSINEQGMAKTSQIILDKNNSNLVSVFNAYPVLVTYEIVAVMNPESTNEIGFISEDSEISGSATLELPIYGTATNFTIENTSAFEMEEDIEELTYAEFKLVTNNEIPLDLAMQLYFLDENNMIIDSLFDIQRTILASPETGANGMVVAASEEINLIDVSAERLEILKTASSIRSAATISTVNEGTVPVRVFTDQKVEVRMGAKFGLTN